MIILLRSTNKRVNVGQNIPSTPLKLKPK